MAAELRGCRIAILAAEGVEQVELEWPRKAVQEAGARSGVQKDVARESSDLQ
jgi:protease I